MKMSIPYSGTKTRSIGVMAAIIKHLKIVNLTPVKRINFRFDPFHEQVKPIRLVSFLRLLAHPRKLWKGVANSHLYFFHKIFFIICIRFFTFVMLSKIVYLLSSDSWKVKNNFIKNPKNKISYTKLSKL